jgi:hypothetical protein
MGAVHNVIWRIVLISGLLVVMGCAATYKPRPMDEVLFKDRAQTKSEGNFKVTAAVLSAEETKAVFGLPLYRKGIQPVWFEITNNDDKPTWFLPYSVDPHYFPPLEVAYYFHRTFQKTYNSQLDQFFLANEMGLHTPSGATRSGFVFTRMDLGTKIFNVDLVGDDNQATSFTFFIAVPGLNVDHQDIELDKLYTAKQVVDYDEAGFRKALGKLDCCTTDADAADPGAPVNLVLVGKAEDLHQILVRSGWDETAATDQSSSAQQDVPGDAGQAYRYRPVTRLYYYGRDQDVSFRTWRTEGLGGYVLRLWLSPMRLEGKPVWVGLVVKDVDLPAFSFKNHIIDLDEDRTYFVQKMWFFQGMKKYAFVAGTGKSTFSGLKPISEDIDYISDGYRAVLWVSEEPIPENKVTFIDWDNPPDR